jgi:cation:H+ antiporter
VAARADHGAIYDKSLALQEVDAALIPETTNGQPLVVPLLIALGGLVLVVLGGRFLVEGAVSLARGLGIAETVIGLTIVAVGTSMPELVTSAVAGLRRQGDVAFGNIVGSNIYNILGIGGFTALIAPGVVPFVIVSFDNLVMIGVSAALLLVAWTGFRISRLEGLALLAGYAVYVYLIWP